MSLHDLEEMQRTTLPIIFGTSTGLVCLAGASANVVLHWIAALGVLCFLGGCGTAGVLNYRQWRREADQKRQARKVLEERLTPAAISFLDVLSRRRGWSFAYDEDGDFVAGYRKNPFWTFADLVVPRTVFEDLAGRCPSGGAHRGGGAPSGSSVKQASHAWRELEGVNQSIVADRRDPFIVPPLVLWVGGGLGLSYLLKSYLGDVGGAVVGMLTSTLLVGGWLWQADRKDRRARRDGLADDPRRG